MCGIAAYAGRQDTVTNILTLMIELQHRGQEASGLAVASTDGEVHSFTNRGTVLEILNAENLLSAVQIRGGIFGGIGHVRYSTSGPFFHYSAQPLVVGNSRYRIAVAFNGTIANYTELAREFSMDRGDGDSTVFANLIYRLAVEFDGDVVEALRVLPEYVVGGYSVAVVTSEPRIVIARDPRGFRPLAYSFTGAEFYAASETSALDAVGAGVWMEVLPGEVISFDGKALEVARASMAECVAPCIFEYVYFSRLDSVFNGVSIYRARFEMGRELAKVAPVEADVVVPVPDSGRAAALGYGRESGMPVEEGIVANKYVGRGFIAPPPVREVVSKLKYGFVKDVLNGRRVVLVDDSIVRGTTMRSIVSRMRSVGAQEIHVRVSSPPFRYPCFMGIDVSSRDELLVWRTVYEKDIAKHVEADSLGYNTLKGLMRATGLATFCAACFTGVYPFGDLKLEDLERMFVR